MKNTLKTIALSAAAALGLSALPAAAQDVDKAPATEVTYKEFEGLTINQAEKNVQTANAMIAAEVLKASADQDTVTYLCIDAAETTKIDFNQAVNSSMPNITYGVNFMFMALTPVDEKTYKAYSANLNICAASNDTKSVANVLQLTNRFNANTFSQVRFYEGFTRSVVKPQPKTPAIPAM